MNPIEQFLVEVERRFQHEAEPGAMSGAMAELRSHLAESAHDLHLNGTPRDEAEKEAIRRLGEGWKTDVRLRERSRKWTRVAFALPLATFLAMWLFGMASSPVYPSNFEMRLSTATSIVFLCAFVVACIWTGRRAPLFGLLTAIPGAVVGFGLWIVLSVHFMVGMEPYYHPEYQVRQFIAADRAYFDRSERDIGETRQFLADLEAGKRQLAPDWQGRIWVPAARTSQNRKNDYQLMTIGVNPDAPSMVFHGQFSTGEKYIYASLDRTTAIAPAELAQDRAYFEGHIVPDFDLAYKTRWRQLPAVLSRDWGYSAAVGGTALGFMLFGWLLGQALDRRGQRKNRQTT